MFWSLSVFAAGIRSFDMSGGCGVSYMRQAIAMSAAFLLVGSALLVIGGGLGGVA